MPSKWHRWKVCQHLLAVDQQIKTWREGFDVLGLSYINPIIEWLQWLWVAQAQVLADREQQSIDLNTTACQKELIASFRVSLPQFQGPSRSPIPFFTICANQVVEPFLHCCIILIPFSQLFSLSLYHLLFCLSCVSGDLAHRAVTHIW